MGVSEATTLSDAARSRLAVYLRSGYGVEDFALKNGVDLEDTRACVRYWRQTGILLRIMGVDHRRNTEARRIMGV